MRVVCDRVSVLCVVLCVVFVCVHCLWLWFCVLVASCLLVGVGGGVSAAWLLSAAWFCLLLLA